MKQTTKIMATSAAALALVAGASVGIASADPTSSPAPTAPASPTTAQKGHPGGHRGRLLTRALHGEVTLAGPRHRVVVFQRGKVESIDASSITVTSADGFTGTYVLAPTTKVRQDRAPGKITDVTSRDVVRVVAVRTGKTATAKLVAERT